MLESRGCPVLAQAMTLGRSVQLPGGTHSPDARTVLRGRGLRGRSPALLVPLLAEGRTVAGLLLLSPGSQREWDDATRLGLEQEAGRLGARLQAWIGRSTGGGGGGGEGGGVGGGGGQTGGAAAGLDRPFDGRGGRHRCDARPGPGASADHRARVASRTGRRAALRTGRGG